jgi:hypothetical protein
VTSKLFSTYVIISNCLPLLSKCRKWQVSLIKNVKMYRSRGDSLMLIGLGHHTAGTISRDGFDSARVLAEVKVVPGQLRTSQV